MNILSMIKVYFTNNSNKNNKTQSDIDNPYLTARRSWNDHSARLKTEKLLWQLVAMVCLILTMASVGGLIYIGSQSKFVPYLIEVDKLGKTLAYASAQPSKMPNKTIIRAQLAEFVAQARMITPDTGLQRKAIFRVYSMLNQKDAAFTEMNDFYQKRDVFKRAADETVSINISSALPQTDKSWEVEWVETVRDRDGALKSRSNWRGILTIYYAPINEKTSEEQLMKNPTGLFVSHFSWSRQM